MATLHYTSGNNIDSQGNYTPSTAGFNLADVSSVDELNALPSGVKGLVWLDQGDGVTQSFMDAVKPFIGNPKVFGFFLKDEPDPTGQWNPLTTAANLKAESDYIHANVAGAKTFITMMNMGSSDNPSFANTYTPANTHIDLFGIDPYPVRSDASTIDYNMIDKAVAAAEASGIPVADIVPVFQTFGGGNWVDDSGGHYVMPTAAQEQQMLSHWAALVPNPAFDYAYAWGSQNGDTALESSSALQSVFLQHNTAGSTSTGGTSTGSGTPIVDAPAPVDTSGSSSTSGSTTPVTSTSGGTTTTTGSTSSGGTTTGSTSTTGTTSTGSTSPTDPTTSTSDGTGHHHHHHGLSFSQLTTSTSPLASTTTTAATSLTTTTDTTSSHTTDVTAPVQIDLSHHNDYQHTWHW